MAFPGYAQRNESTRAFTHTCLRPLLTSSPAFSPIARPTFALTGPPSGINTIANVAPTSPQIFLPGFDLRKSAVPVAACLAMSPVADVASWVNFVAFFAVRDASFSACINAFFATRDVSFSAHRNVFSPARDAFLTTLVTAFQFINLTLMRTAY